MGAPSGSGNGNLIGAIGSGLGALGGAAISAFSTGSMNKKTRQWNEHMYWLQREQALNDWARQNEYDNPAAQMERLKAAGVCTECAGKKGPVMEGRLICRPCRDHDNILRIAQRKRKLIAQ